VLDFVFRDGPVKIENLFEIPRFSGVSGVPSSADNTRYFQNSHYSVLVIITGTNVKYNQNIAIQ
jgi:hypothetical protein